MIAKLRLLIAALIVCSQYGCIAAQETNSPTAIFEEIADQWIDRYLAADLDGLMNLYTNDAMVMLHGKPALRGKKQIRAFFEPSLGTARVTFEIEIERAEIFGPVAYIVSKYWMSVHAHDSDEVFTDVGRSLLIYKQDDQGHWKIHADIDQATPDVTWPR